MLMRNHNTLKTHIKIKIKQCALMSLLSICTFSAGAGNLDLADNALEVISPVEPNIVILSDDSGSMDLGIMATGPESGNDGELTFNGRLYSYTHPDPNASGNAPAINIFSREHAPTEEYLKNTLNVSAPYHGTWRAWNKDFNRVYYDPDVTYKPWAGINKNNNAYANASPTAALYNPYEPSNGSLNLTTTTPNYSSRYGNSNITVTGFYPARYYTWADSDNDGYVDAAEPRTLIEIRQSGCSTGATCPANFTQSAYDNATGLGRSDCAAVNGNGTVTCTYAEEIQNFANWFSYYRKRGLAANANFGFIIETNTTARIGYATIHNNNSVAIPVASMNVSAKSGNKKNLLDKIYRTLPSGGTPLRANLREVGEYFECQNSGIFSSVSPAPACPIQPAPAGACQQNYAVLMTDGFYNGSNPYSLDANKDANTSNPFDGGATSDTVSNTLADVAMDFYKKDLSTLIDDVSATPKDISRHPEGYPNDSNGEPEAMHQHMATYTVGFGVSGSLISMPNNPLAAFTWPDPGTSSTAKIDDLRHAAYNGRGDFLQATNPTVLQKGLQAIFEEIGQSGGAASAVAFNTQNIDSGSLVFRAFFDTKLNTGDLVAQRVNQNGTIDSGIVWSAAEQLDNKVPSNRVIITYQDAGTNSAGRAFVWNQLTSGTNSQQAYLNAPQPANVASAVGSDRLNWIRGVKTKEGPSFDDGQFRERGDDSLLGDFIHSAPVFVGEPEFSGRDNSPFPTASSSVLYSTFRQNNANRKKLVYAGANDGMLHAFEAATGQETFAYIPNLVYANLSKLTDPDYVHRYYVDLTPSIGDAYIGGSWKTILVGGLGKGGKGYYALDITDPTAFASQASAAAKVLWEFTEADDGSIGNSDLGYSYSQPVIVMTNNVSGGEQRWAAIFGNGYNSTSSDGDAALYILFLDGGNDGIWSNTDFIKIKTPYGKQESPDQSTPNGIGGVRAYDADLNGTVDYVYAGDLQGNLYRFNLSASNTNQWGNDGTLYKATYGSSPAQIQPITNRPIVVKHPDGNGFIVIVSTGSWITNSDQNNTDIQSIYGVWDDLSNIPSNGVEVTANMLVEQTLENKQGTIEGFTVRTLSDNAVQWSNNNGNNQVRGWRIDLDVPPAGSSSGVEFPGERAVRNMHLRGDRIFINTVIPKPTNQCSAGVGGFEMGFNPITGSAFSSPTFDINGDEAFNSADNINQVDGPANVVAGIRFDNSTPADSSFIGDFKVTQSSDKSIRSIRINGGDDCDDFTCDGGTKRRSWREIKF